jgi:Secretion system C-terminal sorting domain
MKKITLFLFASLLSFSAFSQDKIVFSYDNAGNQIVKLRQVCLNCTKAAPLTDPVAKTADLKQEELLKFFPEDVISYYPNPVKEQLFLKWELINNNKVTEIQLFNLSGVLLKTISKLETTSSQTLQFLDYPTGAYLLILMYADGEQKTIKIIKE